MTDVQSLAYDDASLAQMSRQSPERVGFFRSLIEALHHSRRLDAAVVIRRYKHLVDPACGYEAPGGPIKGSSAHVRK